MADITRYSAIRLARMIRKKDLSPVEAVDAFLDRIEKLNPKINAIVTLTADSARAQAKDAEREVMAGRDLPPLHGVPCTIKDPFEVAGIAAMALLFSFLATLYPALKASSTDPVQVLRYE